jgi:hypothetical protein
LLHGAPPEDLALLPESGAISFGPACGPSHIRVVSDWLFYSCLLWRPVMKRRLGPPIAGLFLLHPALCQDTDCTECECKILTEMVKGRALRHLYALISLIGVARPRGVIGAGHSGVGVGSRVRRPGTLGLCPVVGAEPKRLHVTSTAVLRLVYGPGKALHGTRDGGGIIDRWRQSNHRRLVRCSARMRFRFVVPSVVPGLRCYRNPA